MPKKTLQRHRTAAYQHQRGLCFYCHAPMWVSRPGELCTRYGLPPRLANAFRCTAEHLQARCEGGEDARANIVAACFHCNHKRHARQKPLGPEQYYAHVQKRLAKGQWWPPMPAALRAQWRAAAAKT